MVNCWVIDWFRRRPISAIASCWTSLARCEITRKLPAGTAAISRSTTPCGSSSSRSMCSTATSMTPTGWLKSSTCRGAGQDLVGVLDVGVEVGRLALRAAGQQRAGVREHDRVVVDVDHPRLGGDGLRHLVGVVRRRQAGADVEELADALARRQVAHRAGEEPPVGLDRQDRLRVDLQRLLADLPVDREVVLAAEPVVVDPGDVRHAGVDLRQLARFTGQDAAEELVRHGRTSRRATRTIISADRHATPMPYIPICRIFRDVGRD